ncbi:MAG TPA: orotate phosphoribosyltransferase [Patescibacteria group bacterium]
MNNTLATAVAHSLIEIGAVGFVPQKPIRFKSGLLSPVYIDNRRFPFYPAQWAVVIEGFQQLIQEHDLKFDVIAGIESAGIPHSAALGYTLKVPSVFARKTVKDHGTKKMVEGGNVQGQRVLLLEDHITTGGSSLTGAQHIRGEGATVADCIAITSYEFPVAEEEFKDANVTLHTLTSFQVILDVALKQGLFSAQERSVIEDWLEDSLGWEQRHFGGTYE